MKSLILGFSQPKLVNLGLNGNDALILEHIIQFFNSKNAKKIEKDNKNYFWITYSKISEDLELLNIGKERVRQIINKICETGALEKLESDSTNKYYYVNYDLLHETSKDGMKKVPGKDISLQYYLPPEFRENHFSEISYNSKKYIYFSPSLDTSILDLTFQNNLKSTLQKLLSSLVFYYFKNSTITIKKNTIIINHKSPLAIIQDNLRAVERAIVDTYINTLCCNEVATARVADLSDASLEEFAKNFTDLKIDCTFDCNKYNLELLTKKVKESEFLQSFTKLSDLLNKYSLIVADKYKDFRKTKNQTDLKKPVPRDYKSDIGFDDVFLIEI